jgi:hypothetical protein
MKPIDISKVLFTCAIATIGINYRSVTAQLPPIVDTTQSEMTITEPTDNTPQVVNASGSSLSVSCQDLKTVVQKGDRQAVMLTWNYDGFGKDYTPEKRCQIVSERLQQAANLNGGTFKDLQLASGTVNSQTVICALKSNSNRCNRQNMLFTLKPENARNPEAVIQRIFSFARDGSSSVNESASSQQSTVDLNLGRWEQQTFPQSKRSSTVNRSNPKTGF